MSISIEEISEAAAEKVREQGGAEKQAQQTEAYTTLKSMIIKTANIVRHEMDEITTQLRDDLTEVSDEFGTLQRNLQSDIRATAEGILQEYQYEERVSGLETEAGTSEGFRRRTNQYIFSGLIDEITMEYGIAIGEGVTAYDAQGNAILNNTAKCATFTMNEMAFWQGAVKMAYFSSGKFYITNGEITNTLTIGNFVWKKMADNSLALTRG